MKCKNRMLVHGSLAAIAAAAMLAVTPALAQNDSQSNTPPAQTYQNNTGTTGSMATPDNNMTTPSDVQGASTKPLDQVQNAKTTLASAQVKDASGQEVGQVSDVHTGSSGNPTKIDITLTSGNGGQAKTVGVDASDLKYDQNSNTLITNLSTTALEAMPSASSSSPSM